MRQHTSSVGRGAGRRCSLWGRLVLATCLAALGCGGEAEEATTEELIASSRLAVRETPVGPCARGVKVGDIDGDGKADIFCGDGRLSLSSGAALRELDGFGGDGRGACTGVVLTGDFSGDGRTDILCFDAGAVQVAATSPGAAAAFQEGDWLAGASP